MITITFTDGTKMNVDDESTITLITTTVSSFKAVDTIKNNFTEENLKTVTIGETTYTEVIPETITAKTDGDSIKITIQNRLKSFEEKVNELLNEHADAIMELAEVVNG